MHFKAPSPENNVSTLIGQRLKLEMKKRGISSAKLALEAGVKTSFIYDVISGKSTNPSTVKLARVAECLGISLTALVGAAPEMAANSNETTDITDIQVITPPEGHTLSAVAPMQLSRHWVHAQLGTEPAHLRWLQVIGDSMEPSLQSRDWVLIDTQQHLPSPPGIFALHDGFSYSIKRLEFISPQPPMTLRISSDNPQYNDYDKSLDDIRILGRVVWFGRAL